jgi:hypothetical protein
MKRQITNGTVTLTEINRDYWRGCPRDRRSISSLSMRTYRDELTGCEITLERTTSADPMFFTLWGPTKCSISWALKVNGRKYWGDGWTWKQAEEAMMERLS